MSRFASDTSVSAERSETEIKRTLVRYGADDIVSGQSSRLNQAFVQFQFKGLPVEVRIPLPNAMDKRFTQTPGRGRKRDAGAARTEWEKACRQQWRVLLLLIKAQLEAVENKLMKPEEAFLPWLRLPDGRTMITALQSAIPQLLSERGDVRKYLPFPAGGGQ